MDQKIKPTTRKDEIGCEKYGGYSDKLQWKSVSQSFGQFGFVHLFSGHQLLVVYKCCEVCNHEKCDGKMCIFMPTGSHVTVLTLN